MGRPKGSGKAQTQKRCAYQKGSERCMKWTVGQSQFCAQHAMPLPPAEAVEANALGVEAAAALRQELDLPPVVEKMVMKEEMVQEERKPAPPVKEEPAYPEACVKNPIKYAMQMALESVARAYREDNEERAKKRNPGQSMSPTDRARQYLAGYMPEFDDAAAMIGRDGRSLVKPGWIPRWVRDKDEDGRPNTRRYRMFMSMGCEDVLDNDGRPLIGRLGRAIQMPPEVYAARVIRESPSGAFDSSPYVQGAIEMGEAANRQLGRKVVEFRPGAEHGQHW